MYTLSQNASEPRSTSRDASPPAPKPSPQGSSITPRLQASPGQRVQYPPVESMQEQLAALRQCPERCNLGGKCVDGVCRCVRPFGGSSCATLELLPAVWGEGFQMEDQNIWGGYAAVILL